VRGNQFFNEYPCDLLEAFLVRVEEFSHLLKAEGFHFESAQPGMQDQTMVAIETCTLS
jgi:hypothetical protein